MVQRQAKSNQQGPSQGLRLLGKIGLTVAVAGSLAFDGAMGYRAYSDHQKAVKIEANNKSVQNQVDKLQAKQKNKIMIVNQNGNLFTPEDINNMQVIKNALMERYTFTSQSEYENNWKQLHNVITDSSFFAPTGNFPMSMGSYFQSLRDKYFCTNVNVYKAANGQYVAISRYVTYHNPADLQNLDQMVSRSQGFVITCGGGKIATIKPVSNWGLAYISND